MEQDKKNRTQRDPRAIKAAQRRQEIREENARLKRLREKQQRKAKRRVVKRIDKGLFKRLAIMAGVVAAVVLSMVIFFRVEHIEIEGASYYTEEEILEVCSVAKGDNLLLLSRGKIVSSIQVPLKYVEQVKVTRQLPDTLIITVVEGNPKYAVCDTEGTYHLITAQTKVMEPISPSQLSEYVQIEDLVIEVPTAGEEVQVHADPGEETRAKGQLSALKLLLAEIEAAGLGRHVASVSVPSSYKLKLWYEDRFEVELGNTNRLAYKLEYLKAVLLKEESYVTGRIDLTLTDGDKAILDRDE